MHRSKSGYTLLELCVTLVIICITAVLVYPLVSGSHKSALRQSSCANNLRHVGVAALMYAHDNDETLPPAVSLEKMPADTPPFIAYQSSGFLGQPKKELLLVVQYKVLFWFKQVDIYANKGGMCPKEGGLLQPYLRNEASIWCEGDPDKNENDAKIYMVNDNAGGEALRKFVRPSVTVLAMDGEYWMPTIGHRVASANFSLSTAGHNFEPSEAWKEIMESKSVKEAVNRHGSGANYLFADGHVEALAPQKVLFSVSSERETDYIIVAVQIAPRLTRTSAAV